MLNNILNGINANVKVDVNELNKDSHQAFMDLSQRALNQNIDSLKKKEEVSEEYLKTKAKIVDAQATFNSKYGSGDIERYKDYTTTTMKESFDIKKGNLNDKAELDIEKKFLGKDSDAEEYRLGRTIAVTNTTTNYAKEASDKVQNATIEAMQLLVQAEEQKALAQIEIKKWKLYRKTFKWLRIGYRILWPLLGIALGVISALIIMKATGFLI